MKDTVESTKIFCPLKEPSCGIQKQIETLNAKIDSLSELIRTDNLTGLYNQRCMLESLVLEMERTKRTGRYMGVIMFDLDHFKSVNDTWGHEAGNRVLVSTATIVKSLVRKLDIPCRYGGEEFFVILPNTGLIEAVSAAERIRLAIEGAPVDVDGGQIKVTASFGVDIFTDLQSEAPESLVSRVDGYLYEAKHQGRNRVCHVQPEGIDHEAQISHDERGAIFDLFGSTQGEE